MSSRRWSMRNVLSASVWAERESRKVGGSAESDVDQLEKEA